jgi:hypothetical protein
VSFPGRRDDTGSAAGADQPARPAAIEVQGLDGHQRPAITTSTEGHLHVQALPAGLRHLLHRPHRRRLHLQLPPPPHRLGLEAASLMGRVDPANHLEIEIDRRSRNADRCRAMANKQPRLSYAAEANLNNAESEDRLVAALKRRLAELKKGPRR